jgi:putative transcriptional regulator
MRMLAICAAVAIAPIAVRMAPAQSTRPADLAAGKMLVASRDLPDPNFAETVVLLVEYNEDGVLGLILNRRSSVPISRALDGVKGANRRSEPVYAGGPVGRSGVLALLRSRSKPDDAKPVIGDLYLVSSKELLEKTVAASADASTFHVYLGYAGWTEGQLQHEVDLGAWHIFQGDPAAVFDADPDSLWQRLIRETELRIADNHVRP